jgi:glycerophosphoryl diester phosphodiesterase
VEIIAHRGAPRQHAENTLPGFRQALAWGVQGIELDVWRTRDGVVIVHHDPASRGQPPISTLPADALVPSIPTLAAVLAAVDGRATVYVEIKQSGIEDDVLAVIAQSPTPCAIHAFDHRVAARVTATGALVPTGVLVASYLIDPAAALRAAGARDWWQAWEFIDRPLVDRIHDAGGRVIAWTVNDPAAARALHEIGVDGICTDVADHLLSYA